MVWLAITLTLYAVPAMAPNSWVFRQFALVSQNARVRWAAQALQSSWKDLLTAGTQKVLGFPSLSLSARKTSQDRLRKPIWRDSSRREHQQPNVANQKVSINITAPRKSKGCFGTTREFLSPTQSSLSYLWIIRKVHYLLTWPDVGLNIELSLVCHRNCHFLLESFFPHLVPVSQIVFWPAESSILSSIPFVFKKCGLNLGSSLYWANTLPLR